MKKAIKFSALLLLSLSFYGCGSMPQSANEFKAAVPGSTFGKKDTLIVKRSYKRVVNSFRKMSKKCEICGKWLKNVRGYNIHYRMMHGQETTKTVELEEILNRIRKLELDNNFMKYQLKHKVFTSKSKDSMLDWDIPEEIKEVKCTYKIEFNVVIKELKIVLSNEESILEKDFRFNNEELGIKTPEEIIEILS